MRDLRLTVEVEASRVPMLIPVAVADSLPVEKDRRERARADRDAGMRLASRHRVHAARLGAGADRSVVVAALHRVRE